MQIAKFTLSLLLAGLSCAYPQYSQGTEDLIGDLPCPPFTHDCVAFFQCLDGEINTSGVGLIDVRIKPQGECTNPEYPDVPGVCCRIPGATPPPPPEPLQTCPDNLVCVQNGLCGAAGTFISNATPNFNEGSQVECYINPEVIGVCCQPPPPIDPCPVPDSCVLEEQCGSTGVLGASPIAFNKCYLDTVNYVPGVCCPPPIPVVESCPPFTHDCVAFFQCLDGEINTSGVGLIDVRIKPQGECTNPEYPDVPGVCCRIPGATLPPPPEPLQTCPDNLVCVQNGLCGAAGTFISNGTTNFNEGSQVECYINPEVIGVCCQPPPPIDSCPVPDSCVLEEQCGSTGVLGASPIAFNKCYLDTVNYVPGVCCPPPIPVVESCPGNSNCVEDGLCSGDVLDSVNNFIPYSSGITWTQCHLNGNVLAKGVCCLSNRIEEPTYPVSNQCGIRNYGFDVRSGLLKEETQFGEFPWQAVITLSNFTFKCGASLVGDRWLVTGAHCVDGYQPGDFKVRLGEWQVDRYDEPLPYLDVEIASITVHPEFNNRNLHNDIAVIELTAPVQFQYHINSVCLPNSGVLHPLTGTTCFATGWGKDASNGNYQAKLKKIDVPFLGHGYCQNLLRQTRLGRFFKLDESFTCAGGEAGKDTCTGDGGGPLVCEDPVTGRYYLQGITAWGIDCGQANVPGVYVNMLYFSQWINGIINGIPVQPLEANSYAH